jgi:hypothetical protein
LGASEVREVAGCPVVLRESGGSGEEVICLLFEDHPGRHSFELERG